MAFAITVQLEQEDQPTTKNVEVCNTKVRLGDLQELLCSAFQYPFPKMMVSLRVDGTKYEEFLEQPFAKGVPSEPCVVEFLPTDNPYFYDVRDRRPSSPRPRDELSPRAPPVLPAFDGIPLLG